MKTQLFVGQSQLRGALAKYVSRFNLLELRADSGRVPRPALLRRMTEEVSQEFVWSVLLSRKVGQFGSESEASLKFGLEIADALRAKWIVVQTDPTVGPSNRSKERLKALFARLGEGGRNVAWEPHGAWQDEDAMAWTHELGVHLVHDITRGDPVNEDILYVRIPGLGTSARLGSGAIEKAAESLVYASQAYIVIGGESAGRVSQMLRAIVREIDEVKNGSTSAHEGPYVFDESTLGNGDDDSERQDSEEEDAEEEDDADDGCDEELDEDAGEGEVEEDGDDKDLDEDDDEPVETGKTRKGAKRK